MIIDRIEPIALRIPAPNGRRTFRPRWRAGRLCLTLARVTTRDGLKGYGECLSLRPPMQRALFATIRDAIAPHYLGKSVDQKGSAEPRCAQALRELRPRRARC